MRTSYLGLLTLVLSCLATWASEQRGGLLSGLSGLAGAVRQADLAAPVVYLDVDLPLESGSVDTAIKDWKAHAEAAVRAVQELRKQQERQEDVPFGAYQHAVDMVHASVDRLHDIRTHLEATSSPDASLATALQQAEEVLTDAQERLKDAGMYFLHGAKGAAQREVQAALQEVEDAERYVQQHDDAPQNPHALASRMVVAMHASLGALSAWAERLHNLAVYAPSPASSGSSRGGEGRSCPPVSSSVDTQVAPCVSNGDSLYQQAQLLLGRLAASVQELEHYEKVGAAAASISASADTAQAFSVALSHMERWQECASHAYDKAHDKSSPMAEACRAAAQLAEESVRTAAGGKGAPSSHKHRTAQEAASVTRSWLSGTRDWLAGTGRMLTWPVRAATSTVTGAATQATHTVASHLPSAQRGKTVAVVEQEGGEPGLTGAGGHWGSKGSQAKEEATAALHHLEAAGEYAVESGLEAVVGVVAGGAAAAHATQHVLHKAKEGATEATGAVIHAGQHAAAKAGETLLHAEQAAVEAAMSALRAAQHGATEAGKTLLHAEQAVAHAATDTAVAALHAAQHSAAKARDTLVHAEQAAAHATMSALQAAKHAAAEAGKALLHAEQAAAHAVTDTAVAALHAAQHGAVKAGEALLYAEQAAAQVASSALHAAYQGVASVGQGIVNAEQAAQHAVVDGVHAAHDAAKAAAQKLSHEAAKGAATVSHAAHVTAEQGQKLAADAAHATGHAAHMVGHAAHATVQQGAQLAADAAHATGHAAHAVGHAAHATVQQGEQLAADAVHATGHAAGQAAHAVGHAAHATVQQGVKLVSDAVHATGHAAHAVGHAVTGAAVHAAGAVRHATQKVVHAVQSTAHGVKDKAAEGVHTVEHLAHEAKEKAAATACSAERCLEDAAAEGMHTTECLAHEVKDWAANCVHKGGYLAHEAKEQARHAAAAVVHKAEHLGLAAKDKAQHAIAGAEDLTHQAKDKVAEAVHAAEQLGHEAEQGAEHTAADTTTSTRRCLEDAAAEGMHTTECLAHEVKDWAANSVHKGGYLAHEAKEQARHAAAGVGQTAEHLALEAKEWAAGGLHAAGRVAPTVEQHFAQAAEHLVHGAKHRAEQAAAGIKHTVEPLIQEDAERQRAELATAETADQQVRHAAKAKVQRLGQPLRTGAAVTGRILRAAWQSVVGGEQAISKHWQGEQAMHTDSCTLMSRELRKRNASGVATRAGGSSLPLINYEGALEDVALVGSCSTVGALGELHQAVCSGMAVDLPDLYDALQQTPASPAPARSQHGFARPPPAPATRKKQVFWPTQLVQWALTATRRVPESPLPPPGSHLQPLVWLPPSVQILLGVCPRSVVRPGQPMSQQEAARRAEAAAQAAGRGWDVSDSLQAGGGEGSWGGRAPDEADAWLHQQAMEVVQATKQHLSEHGYRAAGCDERTCRLPPAEPIETEQDNAPLHGTQQVLHKVVLKAKRLRHQFAQLASKETLEALGQMVGRCLHGGPNC